MRSAYNIAAILTAAITLSLTSCVKEDLYNTSHPEYGKITLTTDWSDRAEGVEVPTSYNISIGDYSETATEVVHTLNHMFTPGDYRLVVYNPVEGITVNGTTATVDSATPESRADSYNYIYGKPSCLFTNVQDITINKDCDYNISTIMQPQVRCLELIIEPEGVALSRIESMSGSLSGAAGTLDFAQDIYGAPSLVSLSFTKITEGADEGKWKATVWLLGIAGAEQKLSAQLNFADNNPAPIIIESDLTEALKNFNNDKKETFVIGSTMEETSVDGNFSAEIENWKAVSGGDTNAY